MPAAAVVAVAVDAAAAAAVDAAAASGVTADDDGSHMLCVACCFGIVNRLRSSLGYLAWTRRDSEEAAAVAVAAVVESEERDSWRVVPCSVVEACHQVERS